MEPRWFGAPWANLLKFSSLAILLMLAMAAIIAPPPASLIIAVVLLVSTQLVIRGYQVGGGQISVHGLLWKKTFEISRLTSVKAIPFAPAGSIRVFGSGGLFSALGYFQHPELGRFLGMYSDPANAVVLTFLDQSTVVLSPERPLEFVKAVEDEYSRLARKP